MGLFDRLKTGLSLTKSSIKVLVNNPRLIILPLVSGVAGVLYLGVLLGSVGFGVGFDIEAMSEALGSDYILYSLLFLAYLGTTFIGSFFNGALVYCARQAFQGEEPRIGEGLQAASRNLPSFLVWAVAAAVVGVALRILEERFEGAGRIASLLFGVAWGVMTYFIVPVIVFEDVGPIEMFKRSGKTFKDTWGETLGVLAGVNIVAFIFTLFAVAVAVIGFFVAPRPLVFVFVVVGLVVYFAGVTLAGIAKTALYVYATDGEKPSDFSDIDLQI